jgi:RNA 2',3'-cyclic 3'-phosphodiesterase
MAETWRMFIALELPPDVLDHVSGIQNTLKQDTPPRAVRWVRPAGIHLTLKFLGDVAVLKRDSLQAALKRAVGDRSKFTLSAGGLGCFPNPRRPRVVWTGVQGDTEALHALHHAVEEHIVPLGFPTEKRPFNPHLTLGRVRREANRSTAQRIGQLITDTPIPSSLAWTVHGVSLIRSELKPTGAEYTQLFHATLRPPEKT